MSLLLLHKTLAGGLDTADPMNLLHACLLAACLRTRPKRHYCLRPLLIKMASKPVLAWSEGYCHDAKAETKLILCSPEEALPGGAKLRGKGASSAAGRPRHQNPPEPISLDDAYRAPCVPQR